MRTLHRTAGTAALLAGALLALAPPAGAQVNLQRDWPRVLKLEKAGQVAEATGLCEQVAEAARELAARNKPHPFNVTVEEKLGLLRLARGEFDQAQAAFERSLAFARALEDPNSEALLRRDLGDLHRVAGRFEESKQEYRAARQHFADRGDALNAARVDYRLAMAHVWLAEYDEAGRLFAGAVEELRRGLAAGEATRQEFADALSYQGQLFFFRGEFAAALHNFNASLEVYEAEQGPAARVNVARTRTRRGDLFELQGQYEKAEAEYREALALLEQAGAGRADLAEVYHCLGHLLWNRKQYREAEAHLLTSLRLLGDAPANQTRRARLLNSLGMVYTALGRYAEAEERYREAVEALSGSVAAGHPHLATFRHNLAAACQSQGKFAEASRLYGQCLAVLEPRCGPSHPDVIALRHVLAWLHAQRGRWEQAAEEMERARRAQRRQLSSQVLLAQTAGQQLQSLQNKHDEWLHAGLTIGAFNAGDPNLAARSAEWLLNGKAIAEPVLAQRTLLARSTSDPEVKALQTQLEKVRSRLSRSQLDGYIRGETPDRGKELARLAAQEEELVRRLGTLLGGELQGEQWVSLGAVRGRLPAKSVLVEFVRLGLADFQAKGTHLRFGRDRYLAWVIPPAGQGAVEVIDLADAAQVDQAVTAVRELIEGAPNRIAAEGPEVAEGELRQRLVDLADLVLKPLHGRLGGADHWVFSPDGQLWLVPWAALPLPDEAGRYAIEKKTVSCLVSGRDLLAGGEVAAGPPLLMANPDFNARPPRPAAAAAAPALEAKLPARVKDLRFTAAEARDVFPRLERLAGGTAPRRYEREEALAGRFLEARRPRYVVLSTHGFFLGKDQEADPLLRCGLIFAGYNRRQEWTGDPDAADPVLTGKQILDVDLRGTELVVLSACETGVGKVQNGAGVAGLRQAFHLAGARSVVASLWEVPDLQTANLVRDFFGHLADGRDVAAALRRAQVDRITQLRDEEEHAHPFYWAAFILTGPPGSPPGGGPEK